MLHVWQSGIPDEPKSLRPLVWRMLLNLLPIDPLVWEEEMEEKRNLYITYSNLFTPVKTEGVGLLSDSNHDSAVSAAQQKQTIKSSADSEHKNKECWKKYSFMVQVSYYMCVHDCISAFGRITIWRSKSKKTLTAPTKVLHSSIRCRPKRC